MSDIYTSPLSVYKIAGALSLMRGETHSVIESDDGAFEFVTDSHGNALYSPQLDLLSESFPDDWEKILRLANT
jgi:hypothetical protein